MFQLQNSRADCQGRSCGTKKGCCETRSAGRGGGREIMEGERAEESEREVQLGSEL